MIVLYVTAAIVIICLMIRWLNGFAYPRHTLGVMNGQLADCPRASNCVSSTSDGPDESLSPIRFAGSGSDVMKELKSLIRHTPRSRIITLDDRYLHAEFRSGVFGFIDDVEFLIDESENVIHFRSASRVGYSDLGINRRRVMQLRKQLVSGY